MKKCFVFIVFCAVSLVTFSQVFSTGQTLKQNKWSVGFEPSLIINGDADFILFGHAGYGLKSGIDLAMKIGVLGPNQYFGADVEFGLGKYFSFMAGAHHFGNFGLDANIIGTIPIRSDVRLSSGFDIDMNLIERNDNPNTSEDESGKEGQFIGWIPVSLEIGLRKNMAFIFEVEINVTDAGYHFFGGGLNFYI
ncbi:MAG: hypothetical protein GY793_00100 [Proteobacteria bacterium]|nr:hypothetical protein [Pseudomonadota bacterium]